MTAVVVVGLGYVGLPLAVRAAEVGHKVVGFDTDLRRVKLLALGESYVEDVPSAQLAKVIELGKFQASSDDRACESFDVAIIATPTPLRDGLPDLSYVESAASTLARYLRPGATVIVESTSYPGTTQERVLPVLEEGSGLIAGSDFHLGYSPERIDPGNRPGHWDYAKIVSGIEDRSLTVVRAFTTDIVEQTVAVSTPRVAELAKLIENTFRHVNIALATSWLCLLMTSALTSGKPSGPRPRNRSASCRSLQDQAWVVTAFLSTRLISPGGWSDPRQKLPVCRVGQRH